MPVLLTQRQHIIALLGKLLNMPGMPWRQQLIVKVKTLHKGLKDSTVIKLSGLVNS